ncbi:inheritance of peroxisomes protein 1-domain-containing protein [Durotheca rogersii]|uniref:inheritance of peroxisomes protein 1-domain-containing protein n=1 Tax=Durotheca rogersii TaxID=419775 RepID=UPI00221F7F0B|nr:inheritance of peroxisomes protein 1-domain-containing protein [Durotheca rogersii]KAI5853631.1 inheritance of peroxisomes protein 1-domain-containing protein [Durotheca rogersii]
MDEVPAVPAGRADTPGASRLLIPEPAACPPTQQGPSLPSRSEELVETFYTHPSVKIISFTTSQRIPLDPRPSSQDDRPGKPPASSRLERTIAIGLFRIYRAPGSVAFLSCGSALQPILPKSQCWCIDEDNSRFVLQIRRPQYWRIELPVSKPDDKERALVLREVFDRILLFEKTECPFQRSFTVELPEQPSVIKKAWTPEGKNLISSPFSPIVVPSPRGLRGQRRASIFTDWITPTEPEPDAVFNERRRKSQPVGDYLGDQGSSEMTTPVRDIIAAYYSRPEHLPDQWPEHSQRSKLEDAYPIDAESALVESDNEQCLNTPSRTVRVGDDTGGRAERDISLESPVPMTIKAEAIGDETADEPSSFEGSGRIAPINLTRKRMSRALAGRAFNVPSPRPVVLASTPSRLRRELSGATSSRPSPQRSQPPALHEGSRFGPADPFTSVQSWHPPITPLPPSPPSSRPVTPSQREFPHPHESVALPRQSSSGKDPQAHASPPDVSGALTPCADKAAGPTNAIASPAPPSVPSEGDNVVAISLPEAEVPHTSALEERPEGQNWSRPRHHSLSISRHALSPLPPAADFFSAPQRQVSQSRVETASRVPGTIIHKTVEILLTPPSYLVNTMLKVAAKIAAGEWRGLVFGLGEGGEKIPVQWDYSDGEFSSWSDDDDYAVTSGRSWEVD